MHSWLNFRLCHDNVDDLARLCLTDGIIDQQHSAGLMSGVMILNEIILNEA